MGSMTEGLSNRSPKELARLTKTLEEISRQIEPGNPGGLAQSEFPDYIRLVTAPEAQAKIPSGIILSRIGGIEFVRVKGEIYADDPSVHAPNSLKVAFLNYSEVRTTIRKHLDAHKDIVLDFSQAKALDSIDSLGPIISFMVEARNKGLQLRVCGAPERWSSINGPLRKENSLAFDKDWKESLLKILESRDQAQAS